MPFFAKLSSTIAGAGSVKLRLNLMSSLHPIAGWPPATPLAAHTPRVVDHLRRAYQHLLRVAAA
jgi:hypothetical protein